MSRHFSPLVLHQNAAIMQLERNGSCGFHFLLRSTFGKWQRKVVQWPPWEPRASLLARNIHVRVFIDCLVNVSACPEKNKHSNSESNSCKETYKLSNPVSHTMWKVFPCDANIGLLPIFTNKTPDSEFATLSYLWSTPLAYFSYILGNQMNFSPFASYLVILRISVFQIFAYAA